MKKVLPFLLLFWASSAFAQSGWQPIFLTVSGHHIVDGVEGWFASGECDGAPVVFVKFVNSNTVPVSLSWNDGIFTQALVWVNKMDPENKKTLRLEASSEMTGQCGANPLLVIKITEFNLSAADFKRYSAHGFAVTFD